jgi:hypothetical protein
MWRSEQRTHCAPLPYFFCAEGKSDNLRNKLGTPVHDEVIP